MAELPKLLYIVVVDEGARRGDEREISSFRYTRPVLQTTLQFMGCKARHAFKVYLSRSGGFFRIRERKESVTVLLCGTSWCGKSTLSALLAILLGVQFSGVITNPIQPYKFLIDLF